MVKNVRCCAFFVRVQGFRYKNKVLGRLCENSEFFGLKYTVFGRVLRNFTLFGDFCVILNDFCKYGSKAMYRSIVAVKSD